MDREAWRTAIHGVAKSQTRRSPVLLPGESLGQRSMMGYSPWGCRESDTTEVTEHTAALGSPDSSAGKESTCNAGNPS